jgi:hypothetical protein
MPAETLKRPVVEPESDFYLPHEASPSCPYCGHEAQDPWEIGEGEEGGHFHVCGECDRLYRVVRYVHVSYSTEAVVVVNE